MGRFKAQDISTGVRLQLESEYGVSTEEIEQILEEVELGTIANEEFYEQLGKVHIEAPVSLEYLIPQISEESFSERFRSLWERIKAWFKYIAEELKSRASLLGSRNLVVRTHASNLKLAIRGIHRGAHSKDRLTLTTHVRALSVRYRTPQSVGDINSGLLVFRDLLTQYHNYSVRDISPALRALASYIEGVDPTRTHLESLEERILTTVRPIIPTKFMAAVKAARFPNSNTLYGPQLMGNVRLSLDVPSEESDFIRQINEYRLKLVHAQLRPEVAPPSFEMFKFSHSSTDKLLDNVIELSRTIDVILRHNPRELNTIVKAFDRLATKIYQSPDVDGITRDRLSQIVRAVKSIVDWGNEVRDGLVRTALDAMAGAIKVSTANIK